MVFFLLVLMAVFSSFVEVMSLTLLMPFITLASDPSRALDDKDWKMVYDFFHFSSPVRLMYFFSFCLVGIYLFRMFYGVSFTYLKGRFSNKKAYQIKQQLFLQHIKSNYLSHLNHNLDSLRDIINNKADGMFMSFNAFLNLLTELTVIVFFYSTLLITNWKLTLIFTLIISIQIFIITKKSPFLFKKRAR